METKKQFKWFTIFEYEKEEQYLREMHKSGWKFIKVTGFGVYHFEKCIAEDVVYQLDLQIFYQSYQQDSEYKVLFVFCQ